MCACIHINNTHTHENSTAWLGLQTGKLRGHTAVGNLRTRELRGRSAVENLRTGKLRGSSAVGNLLRKGDVARDKASSEAAGPVSFPCDCHLIASFLFPKGHPGLPKACVRVQVLSVHVNAAA